MRKESGIQTFIRTTFKNGSPIPYLLAIQIFLFVVVHICDLLVDLSVIQFPLYDWLISNLSLPSTFAQFIEQPWSIITYSFLYVGLFNIVFDCLWLYWMGNIFLNLLNTRQFLVLYLGSIIIGGLIYLTIGETGIFSTGPITSLYSNSLGLAALIASLLLLTPKTEIRLLLFGRVKLQTLAYIYMALEFLFYVFANRPAAITYLLSIGLGLVFMQQLKAGNDISRFFKKTRKSKLKVVQTLTKSPSYRSLKSDLPNQQVIDEILDKISQSGYESLTSREKEILFKESREEQE